MSAIYPGRAPEWQSAALLACFLLMTACTDESIPEPLFVPDTVPRRVARHITIGDNFYNPVPLTITVGTRVFWTHNGNDAHTVTFETPFYFHSGMMNRTDQVQRQFNAVGFFRYRCLIHEGMRGSIDVRPVP